jgi:hypothetical protein
LIYHEGRAYRVYKAKLPPGIRTEEGGQQEAADLEPQLKAVRGRANLEGAVLSGVKEWIDALPDNTVLEQVVLTRQIWRQPGLRPRTVR